MEEAEPFNPAMLIEASQLLAGGGANAPTVRIARLLEDLHAHIIMVEGLHDSMRRVMDEANEQSGGTHLDPAPKEVLEAVDVIELTIPSLRTMKQAAQCTICCEDFEVGEKLSRLPGCGHLFHGACIGMWLERAANCPICREDLKKAVGMTSKSSDTTATRGTAVSSAQQRPVDTNSDPDDFRLRASDPVEPGAASGPAASAAPRRALMTEGEVSTQRRPQEITTTVQSSSAASSAAPPRTPSRAAATRGGEGGAASRRGSASSVLVGAGNLISAPGGARGSAITDRPSSTVGVTRPTRRGARGD